MKKLLIIVTGLLCLMFSCTHDHLTQPVATNTGTGGGSDTSGGGKKPPPNNNVCFKTDVLPLYQTYCASTGCHDGKSRGDAGQLNLSTYANIMQGIVANNPSNSRYYTIIKNGSMPPGRSPQLTSAQITTIQTWINQGALDATCAVTTCDTTKTTYTNGISQIFSTYCNGCHGVAPGSGNVVLSDYASAKTAGTSMKTNFLNAINYTSATAAMNMPQSGQLSNCQVTQITKWINSGCPQ